MVKRWLAKKFNMCVYRQQDVDALMRHGSTLLQMWRTTAKSTNAANYNWHLKQFRQALKNISPAYESIVFPEQENVIPKKAVLPAQKSDEETSASA